MQASGRRHVAVVGGGAVGCATAYQLARAGMAVTLLERDAIAAHASGCNAGNLNPLYATPSALLPAALQAYRIHEQIAAELALLDCAHYVALPSKRIFLGDDPSHRTALEQLAALFGSTAGFSSRWLEPADLHAIEPRLAPSIAFGVLCEGNRTVDSHQFTRSLAEGAARLGCTIVTEAATGVATRAERVTGVHTCGGVIACDAIVFATGPWIAETKAWLGVDVPVEPLQGEMLLMRLPEAPPRCDLSLGSVSIYRRRENQVWVGTTMSQRGFDSAPTLEAREQLLAGATRIMLGMTQATLLDQVAALRPVSATGEPIAMRAQGWENVFLANGGGPKGILLSVGIAQTIRDLLLGGGGELGVTNGAI
jgi:glycine oxidase